MGAAQPHWTTCPIDLTLTILMGREFLLISSVKLHFQFPSAFSHQHRCIKWVGIWETLEHVLKTCWFLPPGVCPGRGQGPGPACVLRVSFCFLQAAPTVLSTVDQQHSHRAVLRETHFSTGLWRLQGKRPRNQTLQHLQFLVPCPLSNPGFLVQ